MFRPRLAGILLFTGCVWVLWPWMRVRTLRAAWAVGGCWLVATALVETFVLNVWMGGMTLAQVRALPPLPCPSHLS